MADLSKYKTLENERFEVLTDDGFKDFKGLVIGDNENKITIKFHDNKSITCTPKHKLMVNRDKYVYAIDVAVGDKLDDNIVSEIYSTVDNNPVYEFIDIEDRHTYYANGILSHQCIVLDEFAFIKHSIANSFFASVYPVISASENAKIIIISTPNGLNFFATLWKAAINGKNLFKPFSIEWDEVPGRDEKFKEDTIKNLGQRVWNQEFECVEKDTIIRIRNKNTNEIKEIPISELLEEEYYEKNKQ
jgi:hypothetical protein